MTIMAAGYGAHSLNGGGNVRVLVVGGGGREHAIVSHLKQHQPALEVIAAPGNAGMAQLCRTVAVAATDADGMAALAAREGIQYAIIGPEAALASGVADSLRANGIRVLGASREAAQLESSKSWAKDLMAEAGIPTAYAQRFSHSAAAIAYLRTQSLPVVVKADGLAEGKGAVVCRSYEEAERAVAAMVDDGVFGKSGSTVLIERFLVGEEYSMMIFTDGRSLRAMPLSQDHKPVGDGDTGPNTGGMGAYAPVPTLNGAEQETLKRIFVPLLEALAKRQIDYRGVITGNLIWTADGPYVIEFNARLGDPEAEATLPLLNTSLVTITEHIDAGKLDLLELDWADGYAVCVMLASDGYPGSPRTGDVISLPAEISPGANVLHAGTAVRDGQLVTAGGRILLVTGQAATFAEAREIAYATVAQIRFDGMHFRSDIGWRAQAHLADFYAGNRQAT